MSQKMTLTLRSGEQEGARWIQGRRLATEWGMCQCQRRRGSCVWGKGRDASDAGSLVRACNFPGLSSRINVGLEANKTWAMWRWLQREGRSTEPQNPGYEGILTSCPYARRNSQDLEDV